MYGGYRKDREALIAGQRARISRWFRNSEAGWLFYDHRGRAWHIHDEEAAALEAEALAWMERWFADQDSRATTSNWKVGLTLVFCVCLAFVAPIMAIALFAVLACLMARAIYRDIDGYYGEQRRWRAAIAERLRRDLRGGVDQITSEKHHRHNIFRYGTYLLMAICVALPFAAHLSRSNQTMAGMLIMGFVAMFGFLGVLTWAANRVDATHRRRKWLD